MSNTLRIIKRTGTGLVVLNIFSGIKQTLPWEYIDELKKAGRIPNTPLVAGRYINILPQEAK
jgi:hypothetical protein